MGVLLVAESRDSVPGGPMPPHQPHLSPFVALGALPMRVLSYAYEAAVRRRAVSVGTLDVLAQVARYEKQTPPWLLASSREGLMWMAVEPNRIPATHRAGERVAGLVSEFDLEVQAIVREVEWGIRRMAGRLMALNRSDVERWDAGPQWTAGVHAMLAEALAAARDNGAPFASLTHLVLGMLRLPDCDGTWYVFPYEYERVAAVERLSREPALRRADQPHPDLDLEKLAMWPSSGSLLDRFFGRLVARASRLARIGPLFGAVEVEARRQAVRLGHGVVGPVHTLLAILTLDATLNAARIPVPARHSSRNRGAAVLRDHGVEVVHLRELAAFCGGPEEPPPEMLTKQLDRLRPGDPFDGVEAVTAVERANEISLTYRHPDTGTSHLLLALIEDDTRDGAAILSNLGIDPAVVRDQVKQDLRTAPAAWPSGTGP